MSYGEERWMLGQGERKTGNSNSAMFATGGSGSSQLRTRTRHTDVEGVAQADVDMINQVVCMIQGKGKSLEGKLKCQDFTPCRTLSIPI